MNARNIRDLTDKQTEKGNKVKPPRNKWEDIITAVHWLRPLETNDTYTDCNEAMLQDLIKNNKPCFTGFGLKKALAAALRDNEIAKYANKFNSTLNVVGASGDYIPFNFAVHSIDQHLMTPKMGSPVLVYLNRFSGWSASFDIEYMETVYSLEEIVNIINLAGFGNGIGSGRSSGYGRFRVAGVDSVR